MHTQNPVTFRHASLGSISSGTLRTEDLLSRFSIELDYLIRRNSAWFAMPENKSDSDRLHRLLGETAECFGDDGESIHDDGMDRAEELINVSLWDALQEFAPPFATFGASEGDGAEFGFWPDLESAKEQCGFVSLRAPFPRMAGKFDPDDCTRPHPDFRGEWLHVNDHGNVTLYVRDESGADVEIWSVV
jgi:hypothetical protein